MIFNGIQIVFEVAIIIIRFCVHEIRQIKSLIIVRSPFADNYGVTIVTTRIMKHLILQ